MVQHQRDFCKSIFSYIEEFQMRGHIPARHPYPGCQQIISLIHGIRLGQQLLPTYFTVLIKSQQSRTSPIDT